MYKSPIFLAWVPALLSMGLQLGDVHSQYVAWGAM